MTATATELKTFHARIFDVWQGLLRADVQVSEYPYQPVFIDWEVLARWDIPMETGVEFWIRGDVSDWGHCPPHVLSMTDAACFEMGVGQPPKDKP